ncbi:rhomboid family intramembrane serine protease [Paracoccus sp. (in: a-proteobacteria)]|uniref:rhomboid family intramembrane serine protease n=1 Tax=Paracoccus sp. TaxID=267 RepID=UPI003A86BCC3
MTSNRNAPSLPRWIIVLIVLCCAIQAALTLADLLGYGIPMRMERSTGLPWRMSFYVSLPIEQVVFQLLGFWSGLLHGGQAIFPGQPAAMFLSYGLLHAGLAHITMNMLSLAAVARELGRFVTARQMALIYLISQIAAAALFALMSPQGGPMVGASGAIFGLAGALIGQAVIWRRWRGLSMRPVWRGVLIIGGLNLAMTLLMPSIAWEAHLGGAIAGFAMGIALPLRRDREMDED